MKNNSELLANLGNFVNRATKFTKDNFGSCVPDMKLTEEDWEFVARINQELAEYIALLEEAREREAISVVFNISRLGNQIMQRNTPWRRRGSGRPSAWCSTYRGSATRSCSATRPGGGAGAGGHQRGVQHIAARQPDHAAQHALEEAREREAISVVFNISRLGNQIMQR